MPKVYSAALVGLSAELVEIESDVLPGLPATVIVGLPDAAVQEARERVRFAIKNSGASYPRSRVAVNLAPADLPKNGSHYDLPIALSILINSGQIDFRPEEVVVVGELALDGMVRPVVGLLPVILMAKERGFKRILVPVGNKPEAALVEGISVIPVESLVQCIGYLQGLVQISPVQTIEWSKVLEEPKEVLDFKLINGQEAVKRALEIAAAGGHNILLSGPPGTGKTLLAKALPSILPKLTVDEVLEITKIYSIAGLLTGSRSIITARPFRSPHHSASAVSLVGGGSNPKPGEISLAHRGVLFLDELPEFPRMVLENLRQPLEDGVVTVSRASGTVTYPAQFILVAAQNPCPCGYYGANGQECSCSPTQVINYQRKVSGPLLDRLDLFMQVGGMEYDKLASNESGEESAAVQARVQKARDVQGERLKASGVLTNSEMGVKEIRTFCNLGEEEREFIRRASLKLNLSARAYHRVLKLSRTIADLDGSEGIRTSHVAEAIQYRTKTEWH
jgi:magnesium chelatase family protein